MLTGIHAKKKIVQKIDNDDDKDNSNNNINIKNQGYSNNLSNRRLLS